MNYLFDGGLFHSGDILEGEALWVCFSDILQKDLDKVLKHWNTHRIRKLKNETVSGKPDKLYLLREYHKVFVDWYLKLLMTNL